ncbi:hypothetical protein [Kitasatospora sp. DSM 101779]|uniref:hypothetical protein n=1 Tax=Kitasatospora sp. DSM 101779 TaxID=2853165 RepID=UPI0021D98ECB|nr:hypothetical protein [Kitasatospora sp. DSM 101779]MCU7826068.1 hypothetical protein [Kitasatospora sp. DSM 101779]
MFTLKRFAVASAAAVAMVVGIAGTASATEPQVDVWSSSNPDSCGYAGFATNGDNFYFQDHCKDGHGVRVEYTTPTKGQPSTSDGKHTIDYTGGYTGFHWTSAANSNKDFAEGACFYFRAGLEESGTYIKGTYDVWHLACA